LDTLGSAIPANQRPFVGFAPPLDDIKHLGTNSVPTKFKVTESGNARWHIQPDITQDRLAERVRS